MTPGNMHMWHTMQTMQNNFQHNYKQSPHGVLDRHDSHSYMRIECCVVSVCCLFLMMIYRFYKWSVSSNFSDSSYTGSAHTAWDTQINQTGKHTNTNANIAETQTQRQHVNQVFDKHDSQYYMRILCVCCFVFVLLFWFIVVCIAVWGSLILKYSMFTEF